MVDVALASAAAGYPVFQCRPDKRPATRHGWKDATTDPATIRDQWRSNTRHLLGVPTAGFVVIDLDVRPDRSPPIDGLASWRDLGGDDPRNGGLAVVRTPTGGLHLWFDPVGEPVRNSAGKLGPGVDVRGDGGYVIVPPSRTEHGSYRWLSLPPCLPPLPGWLRSALTSPHKAHSLRPPLPSATTLSAGAERALRAEVGRVAMAREGTRNDSLNRSAFALGRWVGAGAMAADAVVVALLHVAAIVGLDDAEAERTIAGGITAGMAHPRRSLR